MTKIVRVNSILPPVIYVISRFSLRFFFFGFRPCKIKILHKTALTPMAQQNFLRGADVDIFFIGHMYNSFNTSYLIKKRKKHKK